MPATKFDKPVFPGAKLVSATVTVTNTSGSYSNTFTDERIATSMRAFQLEIEDPSVFNDKISITTADGSFTIACDSVAGETDVTIGFLKIADDPTAVTSSEFTILNNRIGNLASLETTDKTSMVNAVNEVVDTVNEVVDAVSDNTQDIENITNSLLPQKADTSDIPEVTTVSGGATQNVSFTLTPPKDCGIIIIKLPQTAVVATAYIYFYAKQNGNVNVFAIDGGSTSITVTASGVDVSITTSHVHGCTARAISFQ